MVALTFPDGARRDYPQNITGLDVAKGISPSLAKRTVAMALDGELADLADPIGKDAKIEFLTRDDPLKLERISELGDDETISVYTDGPFTDLCRGPHAPSTGRIKAFKLSSLAGAYWRGDENRQMLTRIYGTAFHSQADLDAHLAMLEAARENDHRRLGPELDLFQLRPEAPGMPFWLPQGTTLLRLVEREVREQLDKRGYVEIKTPRVLDEELWHRSGHWDNYRENMYFVEPSQREGDERRFALKPMNCPGACLVYRSRRRSYRDLPIRYAELGLSLIHI